MGKLWECGRFCGRVSVCDADGGLKRRRAKGVSGLEMISGANWGEGVIIIRCKQEPFKKGGGGEKGGLVCPSSPHAEEGGDGG